MTPTVPTVKIVNKAKKGPSPFLTINESDFDPKKHTLYDDSVKEKAAAKSAEANSKPWNDTMDAAALIAVGKASYKLELNPRSTKEAVLAELQKAWEAEQAK